MVLFALATRSSSSLNGIAATTGPKISSRAIRMSPSTSANTVGFTKYPSSRPSARDQPRSFLVALRDVAQHTIHLRPRHERSHLRHGIDTRPDARFAHRFEQF